MRLILIRKVTDIASIGIIAKNEPERFEKAFQSVPRSRWAVFEDPSDVYALVRDMVHPDHPDDERLPETVEEERRRERERDKRRSQGHRHGPSGGGGSSRRDRSRSRSTSSDRNRNRSRSRSRSRSRDRHGR